MSLAGGHLWLVLAIVYHGCENERSSVMNEQLLTTLSGIVVLGIGANGSRGDCASLRFCCLAVIQGKRLSLATADAAQAPKPGQAVVCLIEPDTTDREDGDRPAPAHAANAVDP